MTNPYIMSLSCDFYIALQSKDSNKAKNILNQGFDVDFRFRHGSFEKPPICIAAQNSDPIMCKLLIDNGCSINQFDSEGLTALLYACKNGDIAMVKLLATNQANINVNDFHKRSSLFYAVTGKNKDVVNFLLLNKCASNLSDDAGYTPLNYAISNLFTNGQFFYSENYGNNYESHIEIIFQLIRHGASLFHTDPQGYTPLYYLSHIDVISFMRMYKIIFDQYNLTKYEDLIQISTKHGENLLHSIMSSSEPLNNFHIVNKIFNGQKLFDLPVRYIIHLVESDLISFLNIPLFNKPQINDLFLDIATLLKTHIFLNIPLLFSSFNDNPGFLDFDIDIRAQDYMGLTSLHKAIQNNKILTAEYLIRYDGMMYHNILTIRDLNGHLPLFYIANKIKYLIVQLKSEVQDALTENLLPKQEKALTNTYVKLLKFLRLLIFYTTVLLNMYTIDKTSLALRKECFNIVESLLRDSIIQGILNFEHLVVNHPTHLLQHFLKSIVNGLKNYRFQIEILISQNYPNIDLHKEEPHQNIFPPTLASIVRSFLRSYIGSNVDSFILFGSLAQNKDEKYLTQNQNDNSTNKNSQYGINGETKISNIWYIKHSHFYSKIKLVPSLYKSLSYLPKDVIHYLLYQNP